MSKTHKKLAPTPKYVSPTQLSLEGFETPFERSLNPGNRWIVLIRLIPWDEICNIYFKHIGIISTGRTPISPRIVKGGVFQQILLHCLIQLDFLTTNM